MSVTIPVSTAPAAQSYLLSAVQSAAGTDPLYTSMLIRLGQPGRNLPNDCIVIGTSVRRSLTVRTFIGSGGVDWLNEGYDINVECSTWAESGDSDDTSTVSLQSLNRAYELVGYVETSVREDPSLGGLVNLAYPRSSVQEGPEWTSGTSGDGLRTVVTVTVHIEELN